MLNNKRSLLQRARIAMLAIVTILSIGGSYAMNAPKENAGTTWGVLVTNANSYNVTALTENSTCLVNTARICIVQSTATPDASGNIPKAGATIMRRGIFVQ